MMRLKILITGITSRIMLGLLNLIDYEKYEVYGIVLAGEQFEYKDIRLCEGDICDKEFINKVVKGIHIIIHAAAITHSFNKNEYYRVNVQGTINLVEAARVYDIKKFIFISSRTAGLHSGSYGISKLKGEQYIQENLDDWIIFRPAEIYGIGKSEGIDNLINEIQNKRLIVCPVQIKSKLYPIYFNDVVKIIYNYSFVRQIKNQIITINGHKGFTYYELVTYLCNILSKRRIILPIPKVFMQLVRWFLAITKINIGLVPDQIPRLYSIKQNEKLNYNLTNIKDYLLHISKTKR